MTPGGLQPPDGVPDPNDLAIDQQWATLFSDQLASVRKSAENWRTGLAALLGLVSIFSVVGAPKATKDLDPLAAQLTGLGVLCAALFAVLGAVAALRAAYGVPKTITRAVFRESGGRAGLDFQQADKARRDLRWAKALTYLTLAFLGASFALAWYGPSKARNQVRVTETSKVVVCGTLVRSGDGEIQIDSTTAGTTVLKLSDVVKLETVESCDAG
ncbi:hypothetical protein ACFV9C_33610 [Kribbella sp. NPDC059898]|uniref:hypothetical protein n=1 Tax=Kribbella sp. NPDC059898 TaxID=3346995 RepID=UPI003658DE82